MSHETSRNTVVLALVAGAVVFGLVLAGGLDLTVPGFAAPDQAETVNGPIVVDPSGALPGFADLAEKVSPAVVSIAAAHFERASEGDRRFDPFEYFFGPRFRREPDFDGRDEDEERRQDSGGSGFLVSADGLVVTNNHVIRDAEEVRVHLGEEDYAAEIKGIDPATDLALLKIDTGRPMRHLSLGDSDGLRVGDWVMAIGSPQGLEGTVTVGVVSAKERRINISPETNSFENFIQTDAAINFGNSGGPLINMSGEVIGINTAINWGSENIGFAVPVNMLKEILPQLEEHGRVQRGYLGIEVRDVNREAAEAFGLESTDGALVQSVIPDMPADRAGLAPGDIILEVDGERVRSTRDLIDYVSGQGPEATVKIELVRDGERMTKNVELAERPTDGVSAETPEDPEESGIEWLQMRYQDLTPGLRSMHRLPEDLEGVWITNLSPRSPLYEEGVRVGGRIINVITEVNGDEVANVEEFEEIVGAAQPGSRLRVYIRRFSGGDEGQSLFVFPLVP